MSIWGLKRLYAGEVKIEDQDSLTANQTRWNRSY